MKQTNNDEDMIKAMKSHDYQERCGSHTNIARTRISTLIIWYDDIFAGSFNEIIGNV
jgi:hypothetical protein